MHLQAEAAERALAVEPCDEVVGQTQALERGAEHELAGMEDEGATLGDLDELGQIRHRLLHIDVRIATRMEDAEAGVAPYIDAAGLHERVVKRSSETRPSAIASRIERSERIISGDDRTDALAESSEIRHERLPGG